MKNCFLNQQLTSTLKSPTKSVGWTREKTLAFYVGVRAMRIKITAITILCVFVTGCAFLPSVKNKLTVRPVKHVTCWENMGPNTSCGSVTVPPNKAEGFVVTVGWKMYEEITKPEGSKKLSQDEKNRRFYNFAADKVVSLDYCKSAHVPKNKSIMRWEGSGDRGIYVVCTK